MKYRIPLAYDQFDETEKNVVIDVLNSGNYTQGECVSRFEDEFASYLGVDHAIMVNSGSSANLIAMTATYYAAKWDSSLTYGPFRVGDEIVIPALCWPTTLTPLVNLRLQPVFCDIDLDSLNLSVATIEKVRTDRTRAVIAVPILGNPTGLDDLRAYCEAERLVLLEDACQSLGAQSLTGQKVGSFGLASSFSFYFSHHISTIEGGCVVTNSLLVAQLCRALRSHGWTRDLDNSQLAQALPKFEQVDRRFCFFLPGYNVRATEIAAALGSVQLRKLPRFLAQRQRVAQARLRTLEPFQDRVVVPGANVGAEHSWMAFPLLLTTGEEKDRVRATLEDFSIETRPVVAGNLLRHPIAKLLCIDEGEASLPNCDAVFRRGLMLGLNPSSSDQDEAYLSEAFHASFADRQNLELTFS